MNKSLEAKNYIATEADVHDIAETVLTATTEIDAGRRSYFRVLLATTQQELGVSPRLRSREGEKLDKPERTGQIAALETVSARFYAIVQAVAQEAIPAGTPERGVQINKRTNFARTALYVLRRWVAAGNDLTALAARSVTKAALAVEPQAARKASVKALASRAERSSKLPVSTLKQMAKADRQEALEELRAVMDRLAKQMVVLRPSGRTAARGRGAEQRATMN